MNRILITIDSMDNLKLFTNLDLIMFSIVTV